MTTGCYRCGLQHIATGTVNKSCKEWDRRINAKLPHNSIRDAWVQLIVDIEKSKMHQTKMAAKYTEESK